MHIFYLLLISLQWYFLTTYVVSYIHTCIHIFDIYIYMLPLPYCNPPRPRHMRAHTHTHAQPMSVCVCVWGGTVIGRRWQPNHHCKVLLIYQSERSTHWHRKYETQIYRKTRKEEESYGSACSALREQKKPPNMHTQKNQKDVVTT